MELKLSFQGSYESYLTRHLKLNSYIPISVYLDTGGG